MQRFVAKQIDNFFFPVFLNYDWRRVHISFYTMLEDAYRASNRYVLAIF